MCDIRHTAICVTLEQVANTFMQSSFCRLENCSKFSNNNADKLAIFALTRYEITSKNYIGHFAINFHFLLSASPFAKAFLHIEGMHSGCKRLASE